MVIVMQPVSALISDREHCFISAARKMLGDFDPECVIFQDMALLCYLYFALDDINAHPTRTYYDFENWPKNWDALLIQGMQVQALAAQALFEQPKEFEINDNGVVINSPPVSAGLREMHGAILANYEERKERVKADVRPVAGMGLGSVKAITTSIPRLMADRHRRFGRLF